MTARYRGLAGVAGLVIAAGAWAVGAEGEKGKVEGKVVDEAGRPVAGARVRLYRRESRWERVHPVVAEARAGEDGAFAITATIEPTPKAGPRDFSRFVLLADHPGKAVGWRTIPAEATSFRGTITLAAPVARTVRVVDDAGRPVAGARVIAYSLGDADSPSPTLRPILFPIQPVDGPLTADTGADGRATFRQLPRVGVQLLARKPGFADTYAFERQGTIRLTPSATLSGTLTGPDGKPRPGVKVVAFADFMWEFRHAKTDANGRYRFDDMKARGWDMGAWTGGNQGNGTFKIWIEDDAVAVPTQTITLEPHEAETLDLHAQEAGVIRVTVREAETDRPVAGARIWGHESETGGARSSAYTDDRGRVTFHAAPAKFAVGIDGPPEGVYLEGELFRDRNASKIIDLAGGEVEVALVMPRIAGRIVPLSGACTKPDGSPAAGAKVHASVVGPFQTSTSTNFVRDRQADAAGRFTLEGVPGGKFVQLYAETADRKLAGFATAQAPTVPEPDFRAPIPLVATVAVDRVMEDADGKPLASRTFRINPQFGEADFPFLRREAKTDARGHLKVDGIVPGLSYHVAEVVPSRGEVEVFRAARPPWFEEVIVLAPEGTK